MLHIIASLFSLASGGFNFFWGFYYTTSKDENFFGKWSKYGGYVWYIGISLYVIFQSFYMTKLMFQQYASGKQVNHDFLKQSYRKIILSIALTLLVIAAGMCLLFLGSAVDDGVWKSRRNTINIYLGGINTCVKASLAYVYHNIFENAKLLCLSKRGVALPPPPPPKQAKKETDVTSCNLPKAGI
ncbi:hypothetical protein BC833DRAFT_399029 [Globomyces pollinis-pini]|nr:hypothetical protein BC833DRAFT_399029 [Globomyces pollinis-pini]